MRLITLSNIVEFEEATQEKLSVIIFGASGSAPCKNQTKIVKEFKKENSRIKAVVLVDVEKFPEMVGKYDIQAIPTLIIFRNGREMDRLVGLQTIETLSGVDKCSVAESNLS